MDKAIIIITTSLDDDYYELLINKFAYTSKMGITRTKFGEMTIRRKEGARR